MSASRYSRSGSPEAIAREIKKMTYEDFREFVEVVERNRRDVDEAAVPDAQIFFGMERLQNAVDFIIDEADAVPVSASQ